MRYWARNSEKRCDSVTSPRTRRPASVALSSTISRGARPTHPNTSARPAHMHSARWDMPATAKRAFEWGSATTSSLRRSLSPATTASKLP